MLIVHFKQLYYEYFSYFLRKWGTEKVNIKSDGGAEKAAGVTFSLGRMAGGVAQRMGG